MLSLWHRLYGVTHTALLVRVPEAARAVSIVGAPSAGGLPPHLTIAYPFPRAALGDDATAALGQLFWQHAAFDFTLHSVQRFDTVAYLAPTAVERFAALATAVQDRFPGNPLYGGAFDTYIPHLSLGGLDLFSAEAETTVQQTLPIRTRATAVELWGQRRGRWVSAHRFPLAPHYP